MTGAPTKDYRENFSAIKVKEIDADGRSHMLLKNILRAF
jgi:hypothetical protein